jgi:transcription antitermination protein NusB
MPQVDRRESRERALGLLYEAETKHIAPTKVVADLVVAPDPYCVELIELAEKNHDAAIVRIDDALTNWPLERIGLIDRLVMELALAELTGEDPPPRAVVLDEAVELAKMYSTESSGSFVNGVLAAITSTN